MSAPELVIASGDLTQPGPPRRARAAAAFLRELDLPVLAVPGNHDIPYTFPARFTQPVARVRAPVGDDGARARRRSTLHVVGLNSVRPWRHQSGGVSDAQLERATSKLARQHPARSASSRCTTS